MSAFVVDYENVNLKGIISGLDLLSTIDTLIIFYSASCNSIRKEQMDVIISSGCKFSVIPLLRTGKDFLDRYICTEVGELHAKGENEIAIISKDKGFQSVIDYYKVIGTTDLIIVRADNIEIAMQGFSNPSHKERRRIIAERSKPISLDDVRVRMEERDAIKRKIQGLLSTTPYNYRFDDVCDFVFEQKETGGGKKVLYTNSMHVFGRETGRNLYWLIKDVC